MLKWKSIPINVVIIENDEPQADVPCGECSACCSLTPFLTEEEWQSGKYAYSLINLPQLIAENDTDAQAAVAIQPKIGGGCVYFDGHCTIYENRPIACRQFDCRKGHWPKLAPLVKEKFGIDILSGE